jgi:hypothetical protein
VVAEEEVALEAVEAVVALVGVEDAVVAEGVDLTVHLITCNNYVYVKLT